MRKNETTPKKSIRLFLILGLLFALQPGGVEAKTKKKTSTDASSPFQVVPEAHESESVPLSNGYPPILIGPGDLLTITSMVKPRWQPNTRWTPMGKLPSLTWAPLNWQT
jgi:hypothetical protein